MQKEQIQDLAIQYATEGLGGKNKAIYDDWIKSASDQEVKIFTEMVDTCSTIFISAFDTNPTISETVKTKTLKALHLNNHHNPTAHGQVKTIRKEDQEWINLPIKGAKLLELSARKEDGFVMSMIEIAPGSKFPEHDHHGVEMAYILEGDLEADGITLNAGDFFRADAGTHHGAHYSPSGCKALIVTANENYHHNTMNILGGMQKVFSKIKSSFKVR